VLLLPHCLRPSETCPGKHSRQGIVCPDDCTVPCVIRTLRQAAIERGYKGVCVAPGGSMVVRFVERMAPQGIVAVACEKELALGARSLGELVQEGKIQFPATIVIPLAVDGCVDTEVDIIRAMEVIQL
jgi:hypothetical protein